MADSALVVIDAQEGYLQKYETNLLVRINRVIQNADRSGEHVIYVKNTKKLRSGERTEELAKGLLVLSEYVFCKEQADAFACKELSELLQEKGVRAVKLVGIDGNSCIASSALGAKKLGYEVIWLTEGIGVCNTLRFEGTRRRIEEVGIEIKSEDTSK